MLITFGQNAAVFVGVWKIYAKRFIINVGVAKAVKLKQGRLIFGPVVEYGRSSYDSYLDSGVHGWGSAQMGGLTFMAKQFNDSGVYYEGSLRIGRIKSDYRGDLAAGLTAWYDTASPYFATHVGVGNVKDIGHGNTLDLHAKYHYSHIGGDTVNIHSNLNEETYIFEPVNSHRLRLGAKLSHACNESTSVYGGLTWQYEFDGDAHATYNGVSGASPSLKGSSFVGELGVKVKPGHTPLTLDLSLLGWAGKQRGVTCNFVANWGF